MKLPVFKKSVEKMTDNEIARGLQRITNYFWDYSAGDPFGWDWATMNAVFPELSAKYRELRAEGLRRVEATGVFDKRKYEKTEQGWRAVS